MSRYGEVTTSAEVYAVIMARHRNQLSLFETFSNPDGTFNGGSGEQGCMETAWGFKNSEWPLLKAKTTWTIDHEKPYNRINEEHFYWLCVPIKEDE